MIHLASIPSSTFQVPLSSSPVFVPDVINPIYAAVDLASSNQMVNMKSWSSCSQTGQGVDEAIQSIRFGPCEGGEGDDGKGCEVISGR